MVLNIDLEKVGVKELIYKTVTSPVFFVTYISKRNTGKVPYIYYDFNCVLICLLDNCCREN